MKILFLAHNFPPESSPLANRTYEHAKLWVSMGHRVEVVTAAPNYPDGRLYPGHRNAWFKRETIDGIDVVRVWTFLAANEGVAHRSLSFISYLLSASLQATRLGRPDVVVSSSPQMFAGLAGYPVSRLKRVPWVLEIRDLWPESIVAVGALRDGVVIRTLKAIERFIYRKADHIVSLTHAFCRHFEHLGVRSEKISVLTNGADLQLFGKPVHDPALAAELGLSGKFVAAYCGTHGMAHALEKVLLAAELLKGRDDIRFLLVGGGAEQARLRQQRDAMQLTNVVMLGQQSRERMPAIWGLAHASIVHLRDTPLFRTVLPSKMFEAMAMGLPVILGVKGEAAEVITACGGGILVDPENPDSLATAVQRLADDAEFARKLGESGRHAVHEHYDRRVIASQYLALLERVAGVGNEIARAGRNPLARLWRAGHFLRHVPPRRVGRRMWLVTKRRLPARLGRFPLSSPSTALKLRAENAELLAIPQPGTIEVRPDGFIFRFLGRSVSLSRSIDWTARTNPPTSRLWRMNLHYMEYLGDVTDDVFVDLVDQWIAMNPCYGPGFWREAWNAYALSIRTATWMQEIARRRARLPPRFLDRICKSLGEQLAYLASNLETDIGGNHLIKNIRALATGGRLFAGRPARRWRALACGLLDRELEEQILVDGVHFERSPSYHAQVFADLLAMRQALVESAEGAPAADAQIARLDRALAMMAQPLADLSHPDGYAVLFNDSGLHMAPAPDLLLALFARQFGTRPTPRGNFAFPAAGYFGCRRGDTYLAVDCGQLGPDGLMAHAHGDALSFELSAAGQRIVVDQGVFEYAAGARRDAARAARSHNTLAIEGLDQADFFGAFRCGVRPHVAVTDWAELPNGFRLAGRHDGFVRTGGGPVHHRGFDFDTGSLTIRDRLEGTHAGRVTTAILLHPECRVQREGDRFLVTRASARLAVTATTRIEVEPAVYWPDLGAEEPTRRLRFIWPNGTSEATIRITIEQT